MKKESNNKQDLFVKVLHKLVRSFLSNAAIRLYCGLRMYNPCFPSWKRIRKDIGLSNATISSATRELVEANIISYEPGNSFKKSNRYTFIAAELWQLPTQKLNKSKKRRALKITDAHSQSEVASSLGFQQELILEEEPKESNVIKSNSLKEVIQKKQVSINRKNPHNHNHITVETMNLRTQANKFYSHLYRKKLDLPFNVKEESKLENSELNILYTRLVEYCESGGSLFGLIENEFDRLSGKATRRHPKPQFLLRNESRSLYLPKLSMEPMDCSRKSGFGPLDLSEIHMQPQYDKTYQTILRAFGVMVNFESIEHYIGWSLGASGRPQMGSYLFKYATKKEYHYGVSSLTNEVTDWYLSQIRSSGRNVKETLDGVTILSPPLYSNEWWQLINEAELQVDGFEDDEREWLDLEAIEIGDPLINEFIEQ